MKVVVLSLVCLVSHLSHMFTLVSFPMTITSTDNNRGINNNAWHRVNAKVVAEEEEQPEDDEETE